jgi:hypothetical protein
MTENGSAPDMQNQDFPDVRRQRLALAGAFLQLVIDRPRHARADIRGRIGQLRPADFALTDRIAQRFHRLRLSSANNQDLVLLLAFDLAQQSAHVCL